MTGRVSVPVRWSVFAGLFLFGCGLVTTLFLQDVLGLLGEVIGLPQPFGLFLFATPTLVVGTGVWWLVVERRRTYTYRYGVLAGVLTALLTGFLWTGKFVQVWGFEMVNTPVVTLLVAFVIGVTAIAGLITGVPLTYLRRRLA